MDLQRKLEILADAAKYDASCASSGGQRRRALPGGLGSVTGTGICHSFTPDGRCVSLLKILLTNWCVYDCRYCVNRRSSDTPRARFAIDEVVRLTMDFYRRNCIEGLFLSSGIVKSADHTMEQLVEVARRLREDEGFAGYIHLKTIPEADPLLIERAGRYADRLSVNVELPSREGLAQLAPEKDADKIDGAMARIRVARESVPAARKDPTSLPSGPARARAPRFAPAGQSTQMVVGADASTDRQILVTAESLYRAHDLKRVYYSAFSPIPGASADLPGRPAPLLREHRLYQADWLIRFYGFKASELLAHAPGGTLATHVDPKTAWALAHPEHFPVDVNRAERARLLRVPGIGTRSVERLLEIRRQRRVRYDDLVRLRVDLTRAESFVVVDGHRPRGEPGDALRRARVEAPRQAELFA